MPTSSKVLVLALQFYKELQYLLMKHWAVDNGISYACYRSIPPLWFFNPILYGLFDVPSMYGGVNITPPENPQNNSKCHETWHDCSILWSLLETIKKNWKWWSILLTSALFYGHVTKFLHFCVSICIACYFFCRNAFDFKFFLFER